MLNGKLRPDPKGQMNVGLGESLCLVSQWEPEKVFEQEIGVRL